MDLFHRLLFSRWLAVVATSFWLVVMLALLPNHGQELVTIWGEARQQTIGQQYSASQYVQGEAGTKIDDSTLYLYAGLAYAQGQDPTTINFEHPPLGKYLYGISWRYLRNPYALNLLVVAVILGAFWYVGKKLKIYPGWLLLGQALLVLVLQPTSLVTSLLDYQLLAMTLIFFAVLLSDQERIGKYAGLGMVLGAVAAIKYPLPNLAPYLLVTAWWLLTHWRSRHVLVTALALILTYLASYGFYFTAGHNLLDWLKFEKYRFSWWTGERPSYFYLIWQVLFWGKFQAWWEEGWHTDDSWSPVLPLAFVASCGAGIATTCKWIRKKRYRLPPPPIVLIWIFTLAMMGIYTIGSASFARYLLIVFPGWLLVGGHYLTTKLQLLK